MCKRYAASWLSLFVLSLMVLTPVAARAGDPDPMIRIATLPTDIDKERALADIATDVSQATGLSETVISYFWQTYDALYSPGGRALGIESPVLIDIYIPAFMPEEMRDKVMNSLADAVAAHTPFARNSLFMHLHVAQKGQSFINGQVIRDWSLVGGPAE